MAESSTSGCTWTTVEGEIVVVVGILRCAVEGQGQPSEGVTRLQQFDLRDIIFWKRRTSGKVVHMQLKHPFFPTALECQTTTTTTTTL